MLYSGCATDWRDILSGFFIPGSGWNRRQGVRRYHNCLLIKVPPPPDKENLFMG